MNECKCVPCDECKGSGSVWFSFSGEYIRHHRMDDMDEMETCEECHGSGISEICDRCRELEDDDFDYSPYTVTVSVSRDCPPETLQALGEMMKHLIKQIDDGKITP